MNLRKLATFKKAETPRLKKPKNINLRKLSLSLDKASCESPARQSLKKILRRIPLGHD